MDKQSVLLLHHSMPTILAFQQMYARGVTGAAVKAEGNQMIANLSISDLRSASKTTHDYATHDIAHVAWLISPVLPLIMQRTCKTCRSIETQSSYHNLAARLQLQLKYHG